MLFRHHRHRSDEEEMLRFGVQFADGAKATNTAGFIIAMIRPRVR
jgi:hypothetical protein